MPMESQTNPAREEQFRVSSIFVVVLAATTRAAASYVQHNLVPGGLEIAIRTCAGIIGFFAVPVLLLLGFRSWMKGVRMKSPEWRNGLALSC